MDQVVIEFVGNTDGLIPAAEQLKALGQISQEQYDQFIKSNQDAAKAIDLYLKKTTDASGNTVKSVEQQRKAFDELSKSIPEEMLEQLVDTAEALDYAFANSTKTLRIMRQRMVELKLTGKENTQEFKDLAANAAKLTDEIGDTHAQIKVLASDTKYIDALISGVQGLAGGFAIVQGAVALFGDENEDLQKTLLKVNAAMAIMQGIQQVQIVLQKESAFSVITATAAQKAWNFVIGTSTGLLKGLRIALAATGIGLIALALYEAAKAMNLFGDSTADATEKLKEQEDQLEATRQKYRDYANEILQSQQSETNAMARTIKLREAEGASASELLDLKIDLLDKEKSQLLQARATLLDEDIAAREAYTQQILDIENQQAVLLANAKSKANDDASKSRAQASAAEFKDRVALIERNILLEEEGTRTMLQLQIALEEAKRNVQLANANLSKNEVELIYLQSELLIDDLKSRLAALSDGSASPIASVIPPAETLQEQGLKGLEVLDRYYEKVAENSAESRERTIADLEAIAAHRRQVFDQSIQVALQTFSVLGQISQTHLDSELNNLQAQLDNKQISQKVYEQKVAAAKRKDAENSKRLALFEAVVNTASAIVKGLSDGGLPLAIIAGILGGVQIATIASQPIPGFAKGTPKAPPGFKWVGEEGPELRNDNGGYTIINHTDSMKMVDMYAKYNIIPQVPGLSPQNHAAASTSFNLDYDKMASAFSKEVAKNPSLNINIDQSGFGIYLKSAFQNTQFVDRRYQSNA